MSDSELYKEIAREANDLRSDLTRHSHAARFAASANKAAVEDLKSKQLKLEERLRDLERREAVNADRIGDLRDAKREHTGKIQTLSINDARDDKVAEKTKAAWRLYGMVAVAVVSAVGSLILQLLKMLGGGE